MSSLQGAGKRLAELLAEAERGEEVIIDREGAPSVRLVLDSTTGKERTPGSAKGLFKVPDDFDAPLPDDGVSHFR